MAKDESGPEQEMAAVSPSRRFQAVEQATTIAGFAALGAILAFHAFGLSGTFQGYGYRDAWEAKRIGLACGAGLGVLLMLFGVALRPRPTWLTVPVSFLALCMVLDAYKYAFPGAGLAWPIWSIFMVLSFATLAVSLWTIKEMLLPASLAVLVPLSFLLLLMLGRDYGEVGPDWKPPFPLGVVLLPVANGVAFGLGWLNCRIANEKIKLLLPSIPVIVAALEGDPLHRWG
jgi:hypothetical protein